jgi:hypothetical protein
MLLTTNNRSTINRVEEREVMGKMSMAPKDSSEGGFGIQQGDVKVVGACYKIHQYQPNKVTGEQSDPFPCLALTYQLIVDGKKEGDPEEVTYKAGKLGKFAPSEDGDEPVGQDIGDEGPFMTALEDGAMPNKKCGLMVFTAELVKCGFKESVLEDGDARQLVGLEGHVMQKKQPGIDGGKEYHTLVFDKITSRPYEKTKKKATKDEDDEPVAKKKSKAAEAEDPAEESGDDAAKTKLVAVLKKIVAKLDTDGKSRKDVKKDVLARVIAEPAKLQKAIFALYDDDDELEALEKAAGFTLNIRKGMIIPAED